MKKNYLGSCVASIFFAASAMLLATGCGQQYDATPQSIKQASSDQAYVIKIFTLSSASSQRAANFAAKSACRAILPRGSYKAVLDGNDNFDTMLYCVLGSCEIGCLKQ